MKKIKRLKKVLSVVLCFALVFSLTSGSFITVNAETTDQKIERLKREEADAQEVLNAINAQLGELNQRVNENLSKIDGINATIEANKAAIEQTKEDIETDKIEFQKRLRSIYMSNSESRIKILLGAKSFSEFLQLAQLTASVSSYDKKLIESLAEQIKDLEAKNEENNKLKAELEEKQKELDEQQKKMVERQAEAEELFNSSSTARANAEAEKAAEEERMRRNASGGGVSGSASAPSFDGSAAFCWPSDYTYVIAGFASNDSVHNGRHFGVDIAGSGIMGTPIYAIGDGYVTSMNNTCEHNWGKGGSCGCGGGYGNYAQIDHGNVDGNHYSAIYGHATSIIVSPGEHVSKGQVIGYVGTTGWSTGPHLHFGILQNGGWINPLNISYS
ncbi:MAG: peptidoglycan DD-metalloendopeptidase family protein [Clostridia bacterium]|nr:peptidoglycan DD-metalloendopeptidase family protein [Clostridia bacterium]